MRRFVPIIALQATALTVVAAGMVAGPALPSLPWMGFVEWPGQTQVLEDMGDRLDGHPVLLVDAPGRPVEIFVAQPIRQTCGVPVGSVEAPSQDAVAVALDWAAGRGEPIWLMGGSDSLFSNSPTAAEPILSLRVDEMDRPLLEPPRTEVTRPFDIYGLPVGSDTS